MPVINSTEQNYEDASAETKEAELWRRILKSKYENLPSWTGQEALPLVLRALVRKASAPYVKVSMERQSDFMPIGRKKLIHTYGAVAPIKFIPEPTSPYTGIFAGTEYGLIRLSLAKKPEKREIVPGLAIKFFIDRHPSINFMAMPSLEGQSSFNFFENDFSNCIDSSDDWILTLLSALFSKVSTDPFKVDVTSCFMILSNAERVAQPKVASKLKLVPNRKQLNFSANEEHDVRLDFATIQPGTVLYDVYAVDTLGSDSLMGHLMTKDHFVASEFGDQRLFFRHQRYEQGAGASSSS